MTVGMCHLPCGQDVNDNIQSAYSRETGIWMNSSVADSVWMSYHLDYGK